MTDALVRGWCPGALRPMVTGDGLLVRLRLTGGIVPAEAARAIARCARSHGNGAIELSGRANLQLRGVTPAALPGLHAEIEALGLLDGDARAEAVRNVVASPMAGLDPDAAFDISGLTTALEERLVAERDLRALPGKFGFVIDDGGAYGLDGVPGDVRFTAVATPEGPRFSVALDGAARSIGSCAPEAVADMAVALARAFLARRGAGEAAPRRMAGLVTRIGATAVVAGLPLGPVLKTAKQQTVGPERLLGMRALDVPAPSLPLAGRVPSGARRVGVPDVAKAPHPAASRPPSPQGGGRALDRSGQGNEQVKINALQTLGVAAPFGRWCADDLDWLAGLAEESTTGELRLTPWRIILVPGLQAAALGDAPLPGHLIADPRDPRLAVAACPGAPACPNATTPTRDHALALADLARALAASGVALHVSGCVKGCAHPAAAPVTLVARDGRYDLVRNGGASALPVRRGLTLAQAAAALREMIMP